VVQIVFKNWNEIVKACFFILMTAVGIAAAAPAHAVLAHIGFRAHSPGQIAIHGAWSTKFLAVLSINLGVLNLLPVPVLDGGHLLFFLVEAVIRKPVAVRYREMAQQVGICLLALLMVYAFYNDIVRFFEKQVGG